MLILSSILYLYAYSAHSMWYLVISRLLFGLGGSKVVHRKYIANFVPKQRWSKYYSRLVFTSFTGMCTGPLVYIMMIYLKMRYIDLPLPFLTPGYIGLVLFSAFLLIVLLFFRTYTWKKESEPLMRGKLFGINTTSYYSLESREEREDEEAHKSGEFE